MSEPNHHVGFTGTRHGMSKEQGRALYEALRNLRGEDGDGQQFHHGCCVGADAQAARVAKALGYRIVAHPPTDTRHIDHETLADADLVWRPEPYLRRNSRIVESTGHLIAAPLTDQEEQRSGTWSTVRKARRARLGLTVLARAVVLTLFLATNAAHAQPPFTPTDNILAPAQEQPTDDEGGDAAARGIRSREATSGSGDDGAGNGLLGTVHGDWEKAQATIDGEIDAALIARRATATATPAGDGKETR